MTANVQHNVVPNQMAYGNNIKNEVEDAAKCYVPATNATAGNAQHGTTRCCKTTAAPTATTLR